MSPSAQLTSEPLKEIIEDEMKPAQDLREVQEQVDGEGVLDTDNTGSVLSTALNTNTNRAEHECFDEAVRLLNAHPIRQSSDDQVQGHNNSIPGLPGTMFWVNLLLATVLDCHFGSGSRLELNHSQIGSLRSQYTETVDSGTVQSTSPYKSEFGGFSVGCSAGPSVNTYNMLAFAIWL